MSKLLPEEFDCLIVGAGIIGAACALACVAQGLRVAVVERGRPAGGTTAAAMGHAVLMSDTPAQFALTHRALELWHEMRTRLPRRAEYRELGTLWLAASTHDLGELEQKHAWYAEQGVASELLGPHAVAAAEPNLRPGLAGALAMPGDAVIEPRATAEWLLGEALTGGAILIEGAAVCAEAGELTLADGRAVRARRIVLATGVDAAKLVPGLPLRPRKGHLLLTEQAPGFVRQQLVELGYLHSAHSPGEQDPVAFTGASSVAFNVQPRANGQLLIGSSRQYFELDPAPEQPLLASILARAALFLPALPRLAIVDSWAGFRAATPDKLPLIGPLAGCAGHTDPSIFLATGHEGLGITTSLATAELLVDHLLGRRGLLDPRPYLPARFAAA